MLGKLDRLRWSFSNDKLKLTISGFKPNEFATVTDNVAFIYIPITIEVDNRIIGLSQRKTLFGNLLTEEFLYADDSTQGVFDPERRGIEVIERNDIRPVSFVNNIIDLDNGVVVSNEDFDDISKALVKDMAKKILLDNIRDDGTSCNITIPIELWLNLRNLSSYPTKIGHWISKIEGLNTIGDVIFDRDLTLTQISYTKTNVTLAFT